MCFTLNTKICQMEKKKKVETKNANILMLKTSSPLFSLHLICISLGKGGVVGENVKNAKKKIRTLTRNAKKPSRDSVP